MRRPTLLGSLIAKAAAHTVGDGKDRHRQDFAVLASMLSANDLRNAGVTRGERKYLSRMLAATLDDPVALELSPDIRNGMARLGSILTN